MAPNENSQILNQKTDEAQNKGELPPAEHVLPDEQPVVGLDAK